MGFKFIALLAIYLLHQKPFLLWQLLKNNTIIGGRSGSDFQNTWDIRALHYRHKQLNLPE